MRWGSPCRHRRAGAINSLRPACRRCIQEKVLAHSPISRVALLTTALAGPRPLLEPLGDARSRSLGLSTAPDRREPEAELTLGV